MRAQAPVAFGIRCRDRVLGQRSVSESEAKSESVRQAPAVVSPLLGPRGSTSLPRHHEALGAARAAPRPPPRPNYSSKGVADEQRVRRDHGHPPRRADEIPGERQARRRREDPRVGQAQRPVPSAGLLPARRRPGPPRREHTFEAIRQERHEAARCEVTTCDNQAALRIRLVDNRTSELGGYDDALAHLLLSYMEEDYEGTGYTQDDVDRLLEPPDLGDDDEESMAAVGEPVVAYQLSFDDETQ
jgi:hypothetical protein